MWNRYYGEWFKYGKDGSKLNLAKNNDPEGNVETELPDFSFSIRQRDEEEGGGVELQLVIASEYCF